MTNGNEAEFDAGTWAASIAQAADALGRCVCPAPR